MQERPREEEEEVTSSFIITPPKLSHMTSVYCQDHSEKVQTSRRGKRTPNNHTSLNVSGKCGFHDLRWPEAPQQFRFHCFILQESCIGLPEETALLWWISIIRPHKPENLLFLKAEVIYDQVLLVNLLAVSHRLCWSRRHKLTGFYEILWMSTRSMTADRHLQLVN